jgi:hypothetical protein
LEHNLAESRDDARRVIEAFTDPEGLYYMARHLSYIGDTATALATLRRVIDGGYFCVPVFARDPWLDPLRTDPEFVKLLKQAEARHQEARAAFMEADGDRIVGSRSI